MRRLLLLLPLLVGACQTAAPTVRLHHHYALRSVIVGPSESMAPFMYPGDMLYFRQERYDTLVSGEIVRRDADPIPYVHKIVGGNPVDGFVTQGLNCRTNPRVDPGRMFSDDYLGSLSIVFKGPHP